jgi:hypothetical protein
MELVEADTGSSLTLLGNHIAKGNIAKARTKITLSSSKWKTTLGTACSRMQEAGEAL